MLISGAIIIIAPEMLVSPKKKKKKKNVMTIKMSRMLKWPKAVYP